MAESVNRDFGCLPPCEILANSRNMFRLSMLNDRIACRARCNHFYPDGWHPIEPATATQPIGSPSFLSSIRIVQRS